MDVTVHLDGDPSIRTEGFFEAKVFELTERIKVLESDNAELDQQNSELRERVQKLSSRQPQWPKGYRPRRQNSHVKKHGNWQPPERLHDKPE